MKIAKMSDTGLAVLRKRAKRDKSGLLSHLLWCYEVMFENACDPNSDVLEFKPEIVAAMDFAKTARTFKDGVDLLLASPPCADHVQPRVKEK